MYIKEEGMNMWTTIFKKFKIYLKKKKTREEKDK